MGKGFRFLNRDLGWIIPLTIVAYKIQDGSVNYIQNPFLMDVPAGKVFELMDKEFKPTILEDMISSWVSYGRDRAYA
jgi:hypothetical protein